MTPQGTMGWAIERMKAGQRVARRGWNGKKMYIYLCRPSEIGFGREYPPCIVMHTAQGQEQLGWLASQADLLAEDWEEALP